MDKKKTQTVRLIIFAVIVLGIVIVMTMVSGAAKTSTKYDAFAQCLSEKGAKFYGAFWCPHCQDQKARFGAAKKKLPYIECSTPDKKQTAECAAAGIEAYPTWEFADGSRVDGEMEITALAEKTACALPSEQSE